MGDALFIIFDNEAQFTIDGRTSTLKGPAGAPCRMGRSHAIYNPTDKPTEWMNIAVGSVKGKYDNFDIGDDRVGVPLDPKPVFITLNLNSRCCVRLRRCMAARARCSTAVRCSGGLLQQLGLRGSSGRACRSFGRKPSAHGSRGVLLRDPGIREGAHQR